MKWYYLIGAGIAVVLGIIIFTISGIGNCVIKNRTKKEINGNSDLCCVRYFMDETDDSAVKYTMVEDGDEWNIPVSELPRKEGYVFAGFYDSRDYNYGTMYVNDQGEGIIAIEDDIVLYPIFVLIGG